MDQTFTMNLVGCNYASYSDGGLINLPVRAATTVCSPGWHVCDAHEWIAGRAMSLSNVNRWVRAFVNCGGCGSDPLAASSGVDLCEFHPTCGTRWAFFVGPTPQDNFCGPGWMLGTATGNLGRAETGNLADPKLAGASCLANSGARSSDGGVSPVVGTMCCR